MRLVYFSVVKKGGARSFLLLLWDRYSPFPTKKYYNIEDRLHMEKHRFCTRAQPCSESCRPFRRDSRGVSTCRAVGSLLRPPPHSCSKRVGLPSRQALPLRCSHPSRASSCSSGESLQKPGAEQACLPSACVGGPGPAGRPSDAVHKVLLLTVWQWD